MGAREFKKEILVKFYWQHLTGADGDSSVCPIFRSPYFDWTGGRWKTARRSECGEGKVAGKSKAKYIPEDARVHTILAQVDKKVGIQKVPINAHNPMMGLPHQTCALSSLDFCVQQCAMISASEKSDVQAPAQMMMGHIRNARNPSLSCMAGCDDNNGVPTR